MEPEWGSGFCLPRGSGASRCLLVPNQGGLLAGKENCHGARLRVELFSLTLPCSFPPSSLPCVLPGPSHLPLPGASDPQLSQAYTPTPLLLPKSLQPLQQGLPPIPPDSQAARHQQTAKPQAIIVFSQPWQVSWHHPTHPAASSYA